MKDSTTEPESAHTPQEKSCIPTLQEMNLGLASLHDVMQIQDPKRRSEMLERVYAARAKLLRGLL